MTHTVRNDAIWRIPLLILAVALLLAGCGGKPDAAACEQALRKQFATAMEAGDNATPGTKPPECNGLSDAELEKLGRKVLGEEMSKQLGTTPSP